MSVVGVVFVLKKNVNLNITSSDALIIADVQKDFLPGGALGIKDGDQIIPVLNEYITIFKEANAKVVASRDWHPSNHVSFQAQGGQWPPHCVQDTEGAQFSPNLKLPDIVTIVSKATDPNKEAYSVFDGTGLANQLISQGITRIFIGGLATDYCIVNSVLDAKKAGLDAVVLSM
jgi:nicotinamidase/pyrazinamidase